MNDDIVDRLRDAATAAGETIEDVPPLRTQSRERARGARQWLVPVAAAASVAVAVGAGVVVQRAGGPDVASAPVPGAVASPGFVAQVAGRDIVIRSADRGREIARIAGPSEGEWFAQVQAARDNRVFYAATEARDCSSRLFRFTLDEGGRPASSGAVPYGPPKGVVTTSLAVSGDGSKVAYGMHSCELAAAKGQIVVHDTATGRSRTWSGKKPVTNLSMSADGRYVAYREAAIMTFHWPGRPGGDRAPAKPKPSASVAPKGGPLDPTAEPKSGPTAAPTAEPKSRPTAAPTAESSDEVVPRDGFEEAAVPRPTLTVMPSPRTEAGFGKAAEVGPTLIVSPETGVLLSQAEPAPDPRPTATGGTLPETIIPDPAAPPIQEPYSGAVKALDDTRQPRAVPMPTPIPRDGSQESLERGTQVLRVPDPRQVRILDTSAEGADLDRSHALTLSVPDGDTLLGVVISPDGRRLFAGVGYRLEAKPSRPEGVRGGIVEFDTARGALLRQVARVEKGWVYLLDGDGSGERFVVRRGEEYGVVDAGRYRRLTAAGGVPRSAAAW